MIKTLLIIFLFVHFSILYGEDFKGKENNKGSGFQNKYGKIIVKDQSKNKDNNGNHLLNSFEKPISASPKTTSKSDKDCGQSILYGDQRYNTVKIGAQCWMKENLNVGKMIDGKKDMMNNGVIEKYCYNNKQSNCEKYGGLYQWNEAMLYKKNEEAQGICPEGWHIPTLAEYEKLIDYVGKDKFKKLLAVGESMISTNETGFSALLAGNRSHEGDFGWQGFGTAFWSSSEDTSSSPYLMTLLKFNNTVYLKENFHKDEAFSIRCVKD